MPSHTTTSPPLTVTVLAALWVSLGRCGASESPGPGCDNGKLSLDRDLPAGAAFWDCPVSLWPESTQRRPGIDTVFDPEPAKQICMNESISYDRTIPNSGAYRPVGAEIGEYLYCPPQRWLNNLHHGATVLLYHPCAPLHERHLLSSLARSCLPDFIITPHPQLKEHTPIVLVSWGRTLELSTVASSDVCDWLEATTSAGHKFGGVSGTGGKYNLLLTSSAEQQHTHPEEHPKKMKGSPRRCCEKAVSALLSGAMESNVKKGSLKRIQEEGKSRRIRAPVREQQVDVKENPKIGASSFLANQTNGTLSGTGDVQNYNRTHGPSADSPPGNKTLSDSPGPREAPSQPPLGSNTSETTLTSGSLGFGPPESQKDPQRPGPKHPDLRHPSAGLDVLVGGVNSEQNRTGRTEARTLTPEDEGTDSVKVKDKGGVLTDNDVVDVKERELEHKQTHGDTHSHHKSEKTGYDSVSKPQAESRPQQHPPPPLSHPPDSADCGGCKPGEPCDCNKGDDPGNRAQAAAVVKKGLPRTPRTDEAVWAAAALGFLLILLTLSVLHTRLYRHWRTTPSLYWHSPEQDYDCVADVIRRRLRIAKRRRKRGRRQECVLLPSSSSSDEHP